MSEVLLPLAGQAEAPEGFRLAQPDEAALLWCEGHWAIQHPDLKKPFSLTFDGGDLARRSRQGGETLARACGAAKGLRIIDATGGLGRDAYLLASAGAQVVALERDPTLAFFLTHNLERAGLAGQVAILQAEAMDYLSENEADVVYLDPMFPHREKSAAVGGESRVLQAFASIPESKEESELLEAAWNACRYRVVVKRPVKAPPLTGRAPVSSLKGKAIRFDLYGKAKLP